MYECQCLESLDELWWQNIILDCDCQRFTVLFYIKVNVSSDCWLVEFDEKWWSFSLTMIDEHCYWFRMLDCDWKQTVMIGSS